MNIEKIRSYCLTLPQATEDFPFDERILAFRILGKIFAMIDLEDVSWFALKCNPDYAVELRDTYPEIQGASHMNKKYWNQVDIEGELTDEKIEALIRHSYSEVVKKMTKKVRTAHPELLAVQ